MAGLEQIVVVGASLAGLRAVETLRRLGYDGRLCVIGAEPHRPYDRPPLSKQVLAGSWEPERTALRKPDSYEELEVDWKLGRRAVSLDAKQRRVELADGEQVPWDGLLIATGAAARSLPGSDGLTGIFTLRTLDDCLAIRSELEKSPRVAVVGAGFIGAEVAAACRERGLEVTLIETLPVPLGRVLGDEMGELLAQLHRDQGVSVRCGVPVAGFEGEGSVSAVLLEDGSRIPADVVVVGIGCVPETGWLETSGVELRDGVVCDASCATRVPNVVAAGDVARWHNPLYECDMRVEHWTHAVEQGVAAAERLLAGSEQAQPFVTVPFFWSDQYDRKIQLAGTPKDDDEVRIVYGTPEERRFVALYGRKGKLAAVLGLNRARHVMRYRTAIREGMTFEAAVAEAES